MSLRHWVYLQSLYLFIYLFIYLVSLKDNFLLLDFPQKLPLICDWCSVETIRAAFNVRLLHLCFKSPFKQKNRIRRKNETLIEVLLSQKKKKGYSCLESCKTGFGGCQVANSCFSVNWQHNLAGDWDWHEDECRVHHAEPLQPEVRQDPPLQWRLQREGGDCLRSHEGK